MSMNDTISDLLTRIRNGQMSNKEKVSIPYSKMKHSICNVLQNEGYWTTYPNGQKVITNTQSQTNNFWLDLIFQSNGDAAGVDEDGSVMPTDYLKNGDTLLMDVYTFTISSLTSSHLTLELFETDTNTSSNPINDTIYFTDKSEIFKFEKNLNF